MDVELGVARTAEAMSVVLDGISSFKVKFDASDATRSKTLFGNGRMQVKVQVLVTGVDSNGTPVHVPAVVMDSIELIHYTTGKTLRAGWAASAEQGRFTLEAPAVTTVGGGDDDAEDDVLHHQVRTFWVSSSGAGTTQIAARLSLQGQTITTNGTALGGVHDSSVTLEAQPPQAYAMEQFRWHMTRRGNEEPRNRIFNYYLGLYPNGQQIKLVDWIADGAVAEENYKFVSANKLYEYATNYLSGILARPTATHVQLSLPYNGDATAFTFFRDAITRDSKLYSVRVNDRDGELTFVQALSEYSRIAPEFKSDKVFRFRAIDQHGTEHKLAIRTDFAARNFYLERG
ncbi:MULTISPECIES: hypothetical protein [Pseudomonas]|uniref:hypothetical protein n=1 Tax=Pseudomonas TaxID=286 RepID=UPI001B337146|nr:MULTISPECIES: hypothetical protein [Pseudomonas]MBP5945961.1 hypothetical protein [Pseudomonas sp. P9(2020)]MBP5957534.1 hypothetical protein [Pseudomonas anatoliensis]MBZ9564101.1 hypothetical protein [Pseudomonas sp. P116]